MRTSAPDVVAVAAGAVLDSNGCSVAAVEVDACCWVALVRAAARRVGAGAGVGAAAGAGAGGGAGATATTGAGAAAAGVEARSAALHLTVQASNSGEDGAGGVSWNIGSSAGGRSDLSVANQTSKSSGDRGTWAVTVAPVEGAPARARAPLVALEGAGGPGFALVVPRRAPLPLVCDLVREGGMACIHRTECTH